MPLWAQMKFFINVGIPFENSSLEKDTLVRPIQCGPPASTQAQRKCGLQRAMLSFSLALVSLPFLFIPSVFHWRAKREGDGFWRNRVGEDWKNMTMEINGNGGSKCFSISLLNTYQWITGVLKVSSIYSDVLCNCIFIHKRTCHTAQVYFL